MSIIFMLIATLLCNKIPTDVKMNDLTNILKKKSYIFISRVDEMLSVLLEESEIALGHNASAFKIEY